MKRIIYILVLVLLFSCKEKAPQKPKNLISKDKMVVLLFDMHLANKTRNIKNLEKKKNVNYLPIISKKHNIDSTRFKESHAYYMTNISEYQAIYKRIELKLDSLLKKQEAIVKLADSLKKQESIDKSINLGKPKKPIINKAKK